MCPGPQLRALEGPAAGSLRNLLAERPWKKGKEQKQSESGTSEGGGQRAIRVSAPALTQVPECWVGTAPGIERAGEGRGAEASPPKPVWGSFSPRNPGGAWKWSGVSGHTHGLHHFTTTSQLPWLGGFCCLGGRCPSLEGGRGSLSGCPREGFGLQRLPSDKLEAQTQDFPEKVLRGAFSWVGAKPSCSPGERGLSGFIEAGRGTQEKVFLLLF